MAKIQIFRQSGLPVSLASIEAYQEDYRAFYDKASERATKGYEAASTEEKAVMMRKLNRFLTFGERLVFKKHSGIGPTYETLPTSRKAWTALMEKYGYAILLAPKSEDGELVLIITDKM